MTPLWVLVAEAVSVPRVEGVEGVVLGAHPSFTLLVLVRPPKSASIQLLATVPPASPVVVPGVHTARFVALALSVPVPLLNIFMMLATWDQVLSPILVNWLLLVSPLCSLLINPLKSIVVKALLFPSGAVL